MKKCIFLNCCFNTSCLTEHKELLRSRGLAPTVSCSAKKHVGDDECWYYTFMYVHVRWNWQTGCKASQDRLIHSIPSLRLGAMSYRQLIFQNYLVCIGQSRARHDRVYPLPVI